MDLTHEKNGKDKTLAYKMEWFHMRLESALELKIILNLKDDKEGLLLGGLEEFMLNELKKMQATLNETVKHSAG